MYSPFVVKLCRVYILSHSHHCTQTTFITVISVNLLIAELRSLFCTLFLFAIYLGISLLRIFLPLLHTHSSSLLVLLVILLLLFICLLPISVPKREASSKFCVSDILCSIHRFIYKDNRNLLGQTL